jgi:hypothetical protein
MDCAVYVYRCPGHTLSGDHCNSPIATVETLPSETKNTDPSRSFPIHCLVCGWKGMIAKAKLEFSHRFIWP